MFSGTQARAERRGLLSAILLGSGLGLGLGAAYLAAGMTGQTADHVVEPRMAEAAAAGYAGSRLEAQGPDQRAAVAQSAPTRFGGLSFETRPVTAKAKKRGDLECLTQAVYFEARGESPRGQFAVAQVVMNRVKHRAFPKSVCAVVFQGAGRRGCQFSFACDGSLRARRESEAWARAKGVAMRALAGAALADVGSATHFHTTGVSPIWAQQMARVSQVGAHIFYRFSPRKLRNGPALPEVEHAVLTSAPAGELLSISVTPAAAATIEASLQPISPTSPPPAESKKPDQAPAPSEPDPADEARLTTPPTASAGGS